MNDIHDKHHLALPPATIATISAAGDGRGVDDRKTRLSVVRDGIGAFFGALLGLAPHVLHHIGLIAGAAFITGAGGNALFFVIGLVFSIPLLRRLHRKFNTWRAPAIAVAVFAAVFSLSAFVIGPAISGDPGSGGEQTPQEPVPSQDPHGH